MQDSTHRIRKCDCTLLPLGKLRLLQLRSIILQVPPIGMLMQLQDCGQPRKLGVFGRVQIQSRDWRAAPGKELLLTSEWALLCRSSPTTAISEHGVAAVVGRGEEILANRESSESLTECKFNREIGEPHLVRSSSCPVSGRCYAGARRRRRTVHTVLRRSWVAVRKFSPTAKARSL